MSIGLKVMELWLFISRAPPLLCFLANSFRGEQYFTNLLLEIENVGVLMLAREFGANRMYSVGGMCKKRVFHKIQNGGIFFPD